MTKPLLVGLTGSIGMGKSTTAAMFADAGVPVWSADDAVHRLYEKDGAGTAALRDLYPAAITENGVDRDILSGIIASDPNALKEIEAKIHPLVAADRQAFLDKAGGDMVLLDIPLLFEAGLSDGLDFIVVVSTSPDAQRKRVLERPGMSVEKFETILSKQMPDSEKRARADFVIETTSLEAAQEAVHDVLEQIKHRQRDA